jgi:hypothetical protein
MLVAGKWTSLLAGVEVDPKHYPHGTIEQFIDGLIADYGIGEPSIRPLISSRTMVLCSHDGESFRIAVTGKPDAEPSNSLNRGCRSIHTLASVGSMHEAVTIAAALRKYYLRHFPGRCIRNTGESNFDSYKPDAAHVYIAFFDKAEHPARDGI